MTYRFPAQMLDSNQFLRYRERLTISQDHPPHEKLCMICGRPDLILHHNICDWCQSNFPIKQNKPNNK